ncbi:Bug family tripartite tricarboxylate transporter substrate binding protein [Ramlibacter tataouinensis]|uniref:Candidate extracytoplasmic binding receptor n=1 Tax=Ramlibacter tataouinensis (strain ATCC BAA-407 / DSM 14655 / LMG 21543 / TTB310) TaxID=365046 RepID=F5Y0S6_RAMTT|nr:tripartite tricarboxylate transporter substrate binding protein [Ramlibacter tataouinensis]AEG94670.1 Candidate extracytoplasmic binding receptor [Ramlibacter tataouinensis TTB310]
MAIPRRSLIKAGLLLAAGAVPLARAQGWSPPRPVRLVLGAPPGGAADFVARELAALMERNLGQPMVLDHKPGAAGAIGAEAVASAAADGLTMGLLDSGPLTVVPNTRRTPYDPRTSFQFIGIVTKGPLVVVVRPDFPAKNIQELIAHAKSRPGRLTYASSGLGSIHNMATEYFKSATQTFITHIPYRGAVQALNDVAGGSVDVAFASITAAVSMTQAGKLRAIGVTSPEEVPVYPGVKPIAQQGVAGFDAQGWFVLAAPRGLPAPISERYSEALRTALNTPGVRAKLASQGSSAPASDPQSTLKLVNEDFAKWKRIIAAQNLKFD